MSQATHLYLDQPYENHPDERGNYWATRHSAPFKTFSFLPDSLYDNEDDGQDGRPIPHDKLVNCIKNGNCDELKKPENIIGMQGSIWTELIRNRLQLEEMVFPRLLAVAERAWHKADWESVKTKGLREPLMIMDWQRFAHNLVMREFPRLEKMDVAYYIPPPGAVVDGGNVRMNTMFPGHQIIYSPKGGSPWTGYDPLYPPLFKTYHLATQSLDDLRKSRVVVFDTDKA